MEYDERKTKPESTRKSLIQQVQEQSTLCDVVVTMGYWEKRFHRCVLVTSPFFDHVLNDNFLEKQTGKIELSIGTPVTLEIAIMFLYGKKPKINQENIENILQMTEFLLIPNLKSACIRWLISKNITEENCIRFLQLASIYEFEIPQCTAFIEEHLPEMLQNSLMLNLTKDSIVLLFSDKRLSYVPMDDKLSFLLKWISAKPDTRKVHMQELLTNIDFREISKPYLEQLTQNQDLADSIELESPLLVGSNSQRVLVMNGGNSDGTFWCLDLERDQWFRVESESFKEQRSYLYKDISGTCHKNSESESVIYFVEKRFEQCSILMVDLWMDTCSKVDVIKCNELFKQKRIDDLKIDRDICVVVVNEQVKTVKKFDKNSESSKMQRRSHLMSQLGCSQSVAMRIVKNERSLSSVYIKTSTLYIGNIGNDNVNLKLLPLLAFKGDEIFQFQIIQNAIAVTFKSRKYVIIYDLVEHNLEKIEQSTEYNDKLSWFKDGFVIYNNKRCISFTRLNGPCLTNKYEVAVVQFENYGFDHIRYFICGQMWYRYYRKSYEEKFIFESIPLHEMLSREPDEPSVWKQLPLPRTPTSCFSDTIKDACFELCLPRSKLRCNIECPHCKRTQSAVTSRYTYDYDSDVYIYGDSSDNDYYVPSYYDSDYDYYYDSDF